MTRFYDDLGAGTEWGTPQWIWQPLAETLDGFDLDPAAGAEEEPIATERLTIDDDGLAHDWWGDVWLNPPYGRKHNPVWARHVLAQLHQENVDTLTCLIPGSTSTDWYQMAYAKADCLTQIDTRVAFYVPPDKRGNASDKQSASFASLLATFECRRRVPEEYVAALEELGTVWESRD